MIVGGSCRSQFQAVQLALFLFGQRFHIEVTMGLKPTFVDHRSESARQSVLDFHQQLIGCSRKRQSQIPWLN